MFFFVYFIWSLFTKISFCHFYRVSKKKFGFRNVAEFLLRGVLAVKVRVFWGPEHFYAMTSSLAFVPNVSTLVWTPQLELSWDYIKSNESKEIMILINETSEILISETLESLLTNVEFVIKDSTITNLTVEDSTTDVTENNPISTLRYSIHNRCWKRQWWIFTWTEVPPNLVTELSSSPSTSTSSMYLNLPTNKDKITFRHWESGQLLSAKWKKSRVKVDGTVGVAENFCQRWLHRNHHWMSSANLLNWRRWQQKIYWNRTLKTLAKYTLDFQSW